MGSAPPPSLPIALVLVGGFSALALVGLRCSPPCLPKPLVLVGWLVGGVRPYLTYAHVLVAGVRPLSPRRSGVGWLVGGVRPLSSCRSGVGWLVVSTPCLPIALVLVGWLVGGVRPAVSLSLWCWFVVFAPCLLIALELVGCLVVAAPFSP